MISLFYGILSVSGWSVLHYVVHMKLCVGGRLGGGCGLQFSFFWRLLVGGVVFVALGSYFPPSGQGSGLPSLVSGVVLVCQFWPAKFFHTRTFLLGFWWAGRCCCYFG